MIGALVARRQVSIPPRHTAVVILSSYRLLFFSLPRKEQCGITRTDTLTGLGAYTALALMSQCSLTGTQQGAVGQASPVRLRLKINTFAPRIPQTCGPVLHGYSIFRGCWRDLRVPILIINDRSMLLQITEWRRKVQQI